MTATEKLRNAEIMFGTGSVQHLKAIKLFGARAAAEQKEAQ